MFVSLRPLFCVFWDEHRSVIVSFLFFPQYLHRTELITPPGGCFSPFALRKVCETSGPSRSVLSAAFVSPLLKQQHTHTLTYHSWTLRWEEVAGHCGSQKRKHLFLFRALPELKHVFFAVFLFFEGLRDVEPFKSLRAKVRTFVIPRLIDFRALPTQRK